MLARLALPLFILLPFAAHAQDSFSVSTCPGAEPVPVSLQVDCTNVADAANKALCQTFAQNQACKVLPAYRKITGIHLEDTCTTFKYTLYDKDKLSFPSSEGGVLTAKCGAELTAGKSVLVKSEIGPYDVHQILHVYQSALGATPYLHILFGPSTAEARRLIGDNQGYADAIARLKAGLKTSQEAFEKGIVKPNAQCLAAELYTENSLYLKDPSSVAQFYLKLQSSPIRDTAEPQARFNRMYDEVSGGSARPFLLSHGCPAF